MVLATRTTEKRVFINKTFWVVQNNLNNSDRVLTFIFEEYKIPHTFIDIVPFSGEVPSVPIPPDHKVIARGSTTMLIGAQKQPWVPGVWLNDNFKPSWYKSSFKENFLNFQGKPCLLDELITNFNSFKSNQLFIRANSDYKELSGEVYTLEEAETLVKKIKSNDFYFGTELEVFMAPLVKIQEEYRLVVVNNQVVDATSYKINGEAVNIKAPESIINFGKSICHLGPAPVYCLDLGVTESNQIGVIECNCFNGSGIYGDYETIILAVDKFVQSI